MGGKIKVFIVDDEKGFRDLFIKAMPKDRYEVSVFSGAAQVIKAVKKEEFDVGLIDIQMPGMSGIELLKKLKESGESAELIILTGYASVETAIEAIKLGAYDYLSKPFRLSEMELIIKRAYEKKELTHQNAALKNELVRLRGGTGIVGESRELKAVIHMADKVAPSISPVLIQGESGTGKELIAMAIHEKSSRKEFPFIVVDCSSLQDTLLENELFGHEKGAFTDAAREKKGLFEIADKGTMFLDEIGEMSRNVQSKLLRVLDNKRFRRIGGTKEISVDVRVITATNRELEKEVKERRFRDDLYYRLNVINIKVPPLRDRGGDIPLLVKYFMEHSKQKKKISEETMKLLLQYTWPGNVRELFNVIERALILSEENIIKPADLRILPNTPGERQQHLPGMDDKKKQELQEKQDLDEVMDGAEKDYIIHILKQCGKSKTRAAKKLKISRATLYRKLKKYNL